MDYELRIVVEKVAVSSQEVIKPGQAHLAYPGKTWTR